MTEQNVQLVLNREELAAFVQRLIDSRRTLAPVPLTDGEARFQEINEPSEVHWDYGTTMTPPSKFIYASSQDVLHFEKKGGEYRTESVSEQPRPTALLAVHPCDLHAVLVLERTLLGKFQDPWYQAARENFLIVGLNCQHIGSLCFCASYGTGPFYSQWMGQGPPDGCDLLLTNLGGRYLAEVFSDAGQEALGRLGQPASAAQLAVKAELETEAREKFEKRLDIRHLPDMMLANLEHPVWDRVGEGRCLSCTNCTMVCPTCYCYKMRDQAELDLHTIVRHRQWDSCQDQHFAEVHFGNFRGTRKSRLRQFVCHKLSYWVPQHGCFGCIGCGRCIHWCPTGIDLVEIATEIRSAEGAKWSE